ncbi:molybdate ABC transporter substrate-binding protein [Pseudoroseicyclus tamaricis]|uniref:Molybdate ABC transporter substrate-binding protein n=1 Tax=Pseudoroseicyclus tamaricis TaxID=2705421 RepID=A0A6B2JSY9_9RHOB|nr:molybdate ABC transporter substrate-binding protein [Pseudoroseicyclus tamaricis]NDV01130.1 molybdate ABC transporter substrate-binding protein [Pseudoroseicyclus tamaricis]
MIRPLALLLALLPLPALGERLTIFAAASLAGPLDAAAELWSEESGHQTALSYAGSSVLARQIMAGAPADVFLSANEEWMDAVEADGRLVPASRVDLWGNALVLVSRASSPLPLAELPQALSDDRLAMALTEAVPAGIYGREALTALGLWEAVAPHVAETDNVRAALDLVALGAAPFGIVYATDAAAEPRVTVAATFPEESHAPIIYPGAALTVGPAEDFLAFLQTAPAQALFAEAGFTGPPGPAP